jgi:hypothetical protein
MYKKLTGITVRRISSHLEEHSLLSADQKDVTLEAGIKITWISY